MSFIQCSGSMYSLLGSATQVNTRLQVRIQATVCRTQINAGYLMKQALQDRFDEQSVTLRLTKEANAELQVR